MSERIVIATRGSKLALWQTEHVRSLLMAKHSGLNVETRVITTRGDTNLDTPISEIGDKGLFTAELQAALRNNDCDIAVHSLKDLETTNPDGLAILAILEREDPRDVLLVHQRSMTDRGAWALKRLAKGANLGTGALRRSAQAMVYRPDLRLEGLRGNVDTRVRKLDEAEYDAMILAAAGLLRLGYVQPRSLAAIPDVLPSGIVALPLEPEHWLPASCQGAIAIEGRSSDKRVANLCSALDHGPSRIACEAERAFLRTIEGGCKVPAGVHARPRESQLEISGGIFAPDGSTKVLGNVSASADNGAKAASELARKLLKDGGRRILDSL